MAPPHLGWTWSAVGRGAGGRGVALILGEGHEGLSPQDSGSTEQKNGEPSGDPWRRWPLSRTAGAFHGVWARPRHQMEVGRSPVHTRTMEPWVQNLEYGYGHAGTEGTLLSPMTSQASGMTLTTCLSLSPVRASPLGLITRPSLRASSEAQLMCGFRETPATSSGNMSVISPAHVQPPFVPRPRDFSLCLPRAEPGLWSCHRSP